MERNKKDRCVGRKSDAAFFFGFGGGAGKGMRQMTQSGGLFLFRCTEIRCSKKSAAGVYGRGT